MKKKKSNVKCGAAMITTIKVLRTREEEAKKTVILLISNQGKRTAE